MKTLRHKTLRIRLEDPTNELPEALRNAVVNVYDDLYLAQLICQSVIGGRPSWQAIADTYRFLQEEHKGTGK